MVARIFYMDVQKWIQINDENFRINYIFPLFKCRLSLAIPYNDFIL